MDGRIFLKWDAMGGCDHAYLTKELKSLAEEHDFLTLHYLGKSILGRGIPMVTLGVGKREILYVGAHHGMEWITSLLLLTFLRDLCKRYQGSKSEKGGAIATLLKTHTLHIIPMLNPDGVEYQLHGIEESNPIYDRVRKMNGESNDFSNWQANARGVDLNHNYDAGFWEYKELETKHGISQNGAPTRYSGELPESEPEVSALCNFIRFHRDLRGVLTLHTQGEEIFFHSQKADSHTHAVAKKIADYSGYRVSVAEGLSSMGGLTDWCIEKRGLPAFTLECGKGVNPLPADQLVPIYLKLRALFFAFPTFL